MMKFYFTGILWWLYLLIFYSGEFVVQLSTFWNFFILHNQPEPASIIQNKILMHCTYFNSSFCCQFSVELCDRGPPRQCSPYLKGVLFLRFVKLPGIFFLSNKYILSRTSHGDLVNIILMLVSKKYVGNRQT